MIPKKLAPHLGLLREEYVLVQAWKKTASYIRYHNWFSDTLALDQATVNLRSFIGELRGRLQDPESWKSDLLRIVPAPKSQNWKLHEGKWEPEKDETSASRLRPLAHVSLPDQVVATALMLCLADRVETYQGDPRQSIREEDARKRVTSYGNRLFCDCDEKNSGKLRHRWGSTKLYRAYFQDYRKFLSRPQVAAESIPPVQSHRTHIIHADLRQFYDRVRPRLLAGAINEICQDSDDPAFYSLAKSVFDWRWHSCDEIDAKTYAEQTGIEDFTRIALPQGLVASGFFANVVLLPFDKALRAAIGTEIIPGIRLEDACRYVDDLRILVNVNSDQENLSYLKKSVSEWIDKSLHEEACGLELSPGKTEVASLGGNERPLVRQSAKMSRIQSAVSGGFDALGGEDILDAIQGMMQAQGALSENDGNDWQFSPIPDVRDETVARFGAIRYRKTFRSIRPLLDEDILYGDSLKSSDIKMNMRRRLGRTRSELDEDAQAFALSLVERWIKDPSNVRLLRIGLDLWPDVKLLREVLSLLLPFTEKEEEEKKAAQRVAWYCLAEILRAGATETGLVEDTESLPSGINLECYRKELYGEAIRLIALPSQAIPWYLRQQALLFLAASGLVGKSAMRTGMGSEARHYQQLIRFLGGKRDRLRSEDFATLAVVARRGFMDQRQAVELTRPQLNKSRLQQIAQRDPSFLLELLEDKAGALLIGDLTPRIREDLCLAAESIEEDHTLVGAVLHTPADNCLRNELSLLRFAKTFLEQWKPLPVITPGEVKLKLSKNREIAAVESVCISKSQVDASGSMYEVPAWCKDSERWRFQLGFLLRFILSRHRDFTRPASRANWKETDSVYRPAENHWYQRLYGLYSGQRTFGGDWLPITDWIEGFLLALLRWPGCRIPNGFDWVEQGIEEAKSRIDNRVACLERHRGAATNALILPLLVRQPTATNLTRPLRACVVQTVVPKDDDFEICDLALDNSVIRKQHRNHLSAALAAVERMLVLRDTREESEKRLDWLILPELAVHPNDVWTHLVPFARAHKALILAGMTYEEVLEGQPLVNSALWVIPEWTEDRGLQIRTLRQGKKHLAPGEEALNKKARNHGRADVLQGFRPCQWLIGYPWSNEADIQPVWLSGTICYDATDLGLAVDLRGKSDILAIPALNKDVKTFDQMALALHYHMFQLVIVANNGQYGGSNAYWPKKDDHIRQVFHMHGQPQASVAFLEIDDIRAFLARRDESQSEAGGWKHPPAGL